MPASRARVAPPALVEPPGPFGHWLLGILPAIQADSLGFLMGAFRQYGDLVKIRFPLGKGYLANHPDYIKHVLQENNRNYDKQSFDYAVLKPLLGEGLLTSDGEYWLRQRRMMQPAFHRQRIQAFGQLMTDTTQQMLDRWQVYAKSQQPFDVAVEMMHLTFSIVGKALFGQEIDAAAQAVGENFTFLNADLSTRYRTLFKPPPQVPTPGNLRFQRAKQALDEVVNGIIQARRKELEAGQAGQRQDLMAMLLSARSEESGEGMTAPQIRDEVMTLMLAGHETTANVLSWAWVLLSTHPQVRDRLETELRQVLGGRSPGEEDLENLPYTRRVILETLRLYPPAWIISRHAKEPDRLGPFTIPAGSVVSLSPYTMHRHPRYWPNPEGFDPDRFLPERSASRPPYAYFPFGGGPRLCIGRDFALLEAQLVLATIAQCYRLSLVPGHRIEPEPLITLRPKYGVKVTLHAID